MSSSCGRPTLCPTVHVQYVTRTHFLGARKFTGQIKFPRVSEMNSSGGSNPVMLQRQAKRPSRRSTKVHVEMVAACRIGHDMHDRRRATTVMMPTTSAVNACLLQRFYYAIMMDLQLGLAFLRSGAGNERLGNERPIRVLQCFSIVDMREARTRKVAPVTVYLGRALSKFTSGPVALQAFRPQASGTVTVDKGVKHCTAPPLEASI